MNAGSNMRFPDAAFSEDRGYFCLPAIRKNDISFTMQASIGIHQEWRAYSDTESFPSKDSTLYSY
jgi:hypothetical protein